MNKSSIYLILKARKTIWLKTALEEYCALGVKLAMKKQKIVKILHSSMLQSKINCSVSYASKSSKKTTD